jgi:hypothetical protein
VIREELLLPYYANGNENPLITSGDNGSGYYKYVLQNLFFNALNCIKEKRNLDLFDMFASDYADRPEIKDLIGAAPFLNGGLFDVHPNDYCKPEEANNAFRVPNHLFLDKVNGLNSILSRYKFTIAENTPLEEEIAVDPEMLGRIFENLLAEQSDDTKEAARKNAGAFYTPRPVVSYMCRSTLLKHLDTDITPANSKIITRKLLGTTVLDPACGSGAFPMGMLEEMMHVLETVDPDGRVWVSEMLKSKDEAFTEHIAYMFADGQVRYVKKLGLLRNCLFGVDLLEYAIEITKLRCWLSLIVEQRVDFSKENYNLKPLPNLEFKFYRKNSLFRKYNGENLNNLVETVDQQGLLRRLVDMESQYFIATEDRTIAKEQIKQQIVELLESVVQQKADTVLTKLNAVRTGINQHRSIGANQKVIDRERKKEATLAKQLGDLEVFKDTIKEYFIERVVFPGIFNSDLENPGFDIVIGNPPYVNTKLISKMGLTNKLKEEYDYCDDLYNHFTIRGLELLKQRGLLSYITSDTFLTLQSKKNLRMEFLGIPKVTSNGEGLFSEEQSEMPECHVLEIINTPKAFGALVDTAIFTVKREIANSDQSMIYVDLRKPNAETFRISEEEWTQIRTSKENITGWERVLDKTFSTLDDEQPEWNVSHSCDGDPVCRDANSPLLKFRLSLEPYRKAINYAIFSPTSYNCEILEKIIKPARPVFDEWWSKVETSKEIQKNRQSLTRFLSVLFPKTWTILGLITDGGVGLQTGDNGRFVGYRSTSRFAAFCREARVKKLLEFIQKEPDCLNEFTIIRGCETESDVKDMLTSMSEAEIWQLFDELKAKYGLRIFGKGFMYRIVPDDLVFDVAGITAHQKINGISGSRFFVPYDKGDKEGNRWYLETPYLIDWSEEAVKQLSTDLRARWQGYQFFFRNGFCWTNVLNPNSTYFKCRLKDNTVNDVGSMSLYDESGLGDKYFVLSLNSYLFFRVLREFFNNTVNIQMNDIRKLPIKIPSETELERYNQLFDRSMSIKKEYFAGSTDRAEMNARLRPIEAEIDKMVNRLYGITAEEEHYEGIEEETEEVDIDDDWVEDDGN